MHLRHVSPKVTDTANSPVAEDSRSAVINRIKSPEGRLDTIPVVLRASSSKTIYLLVIVKQWRKEVASSSGRDCNASNDQAQGPT